MGVWSSHSSSGLCTTALVVTDELSESIVCKLVILHMWYLRYLSLVSIGHLRGYLNPIHLGPYYDVAVAYLSRKYNLNLR